MNTHAAIFAILTTACAGTLVRADVVMDNLVLLNQQLEFVKEHVVAERAASPEVPEAPPILEEPSVEPELAIQHVFETFLAKELSQPIILAALEKLTVANAIPSLQDINNEKIQAVDKAKKEHEKVEQQKTKQTREKYGYLDSLRKDIENQLETYRSRNVSRTDVYKNVDVGAITTISQELQKKLTEKAKRKEKITLDDLQGLLAKKRDTIITVLQQGIQLLLFNGQVKASEKGRIQKFVMGPIEQISNIIKNAFDAEKAGFDEDAWLAVWRRQKAQALKEQYEKSVWTPETEVLYGKLFAELKLPEDMVRNINAVREFRDRYTKPITQASILIAMGRKNLLGLVLTWQQQRQIADKIKGVEGKIPLGVGLGVTINSENLKKLIADKLEGLGAPEPPPAETIPVVAKPVEGKRNLMEEEGRMPGCATAKRRLSLEENKQAFFGELRNTYTEESIKTCFAKEIRESGSKNLEEYIKSLLD